MTELPEHFVLGILPDGTSIQKDYIRIIRVIRCLIAQGHEDPGHDLGIVFVHLTTVCTYVEFPSCSKAFEFIINGEVIMILDFLFPAFFCFFQRRRNIDALKILTVILLAFS